MPTGQIYSSNVPQTSLAGGITNVAVSLTVASAAGWPVTYPFTIAVDIGNTNQELMDVTAAAGTTFTVTRGVDGSTGVAHGLGATVTHTGIARDFREARAHIDANGGNDATGKAVHGLAGNVVGTTDAQVLTNKTLTAPAISAPVLSGSATGVYTLAGTPTITAPTITSPAVTGTVSGGASYTAPTIAGGTFSGTIAGTPTYSGPPVFAGGAFIGGGSTLDTSAASATIPVTGPTLQTYASPFSGAGFVIGNGTMYGKYVKYGRQVFVEMSIILGTTTVMTGILGSLPLPATGAVVINGYGKSGGNNVIFTGVNDPGNSVVVITYPTGAAAGSPVGVGFVGTATPYVWVAGDFIFLKTTYQATT